MLNYTNVLKKIESTGNKSWLVGDTVRMLEMGIQPDLITLAIDNKDLYSVAMALDSSNSFTVDARGPHPALRGEISGVKFRAFSLRGESIEDDLACRDLSIEAIAIRSDGGIVDPFGGRFDIRNKVIRLTGDNVGLIKEDPLRILRMLRFAAELEMDIFWKSSSDVRKFLESHADTLKDIPAERWGREIIKGISRRPCRFIEMCNDYGLIPFFLQPLEDLKNISDGAGGNLFDHVLKTLYAIEKRIDTHKIMQTRAFILAGLFSRIGTDQLSLKMRNKTADRMVEEILTSWNIPSEVIEEVLEISRSYRRFYEPMSEELLCREVLEYDATAVEIALEFALCIAQIEGFRPGYKEALEENHWNLDQVLRRFNAVTLQTEGADRYLTGREVMSLLNMKPGKRVGELLNALDMAVGTGKVSSRARAEEWLKAQI